MRIVLVESLLLNHLPKHPLTIVPLSALDPKREFYRAMLLQPQGKLIGNSSRIGHADQVAAASMCSSFLKKANESHADLVITPEYCTPWSVIDDVVSGSILPPHGTLWVLGCESLTPNELREVEAKLIGSNKNSVRLLREDFLDSRQEIHKQFLTP